MHAFEQHAVELTILLAERMKCTSFGRYFGSDNSAIFLLTEWFISQQFAVASIRMVTPGA